MSVNSKNPETMVLHAGPRSDPATGAVAVPIYQTTSYEFRSTEHAANLFALKDFGNIYSRIMNPTCDALEQKIAALEGGVAALAVSSGQAASAMAIQNLCRPGDNIVSSTDLYGGTWNLFANTLPPWASPCASSIQRTRSRSAGPPTTAPAPTTRRRLPNPKLSRVPHRRGGGDRARARRAADHGQHGGAHNLPAVRPRRSHRRPLDDQVHRRARHLDRRHHRRWRQLRLGGARGALPHAQRARSQLPRRGLDRGGEAAGTDRLHHPRQGRAAARYGRA